MIEIEKLKNICDEDVLKINDGGFGTLQKMLNLSYIEQVKQGLLAIENDNAYSLIKCANVVWQDKSTPNVYALYYIGYQYIDNNEVITFDWEGEPATNLPTIKASELWDIIQNKKIDK